jgi:hypothetical protein
MKEGLVIKHLEYYNTNNAFRNSGYSKGLLFGLRNLNFIAMVGRCKCSHRVSDTSRAGMQT